MLKSVYFIGIGGIGMSAIARWFLHRGVAVAGYDRTPSPLTEALAAQGAQIHFEDDPALIPPTDPQDTLVIYTPAVPADHRELNYLRERGFRVVKRSQALGRLAEGKYVMAVAGTHGKTTTTTLLAWLNHLAGGGGSAFLGGISRNFDSNLVLGAGDRLAVEADEFDRSFLQLHPDVAVITSTDADHLDIYGTPEAMREAFAQFAAQVRRAVIVKLGAELDMREVGAKIYRYGFDTECDFYARNLRLLDGGYYRFDLVTPSEVIADCSVGVPGWVNVENAVAACAMMWVAGYDRELLREALRSFEGVKRRFEFYINTPERVYMDDYAHHPAELRAALGSLRAMFPARAITAVFQPHLYSRTRDFHREFAEALSLADRVVLLPIYPAREEPIDGVDSALIMRHVSKPCTIVEKEELVDYLATQPLDVLATFGAGDIDRYPESIAAMLQENRKQKTGNRKQETGNRD